ncbi:MAG: amidohydrolase family protein [Bryobacterales bacterium]|nr:amidohydrolase family protein [Bryobacterales bacterium]
MLAATNCLTRRSVLASLLAAPAAPLCAQLSVGLQQRLAAAIDRIAIVNTHEHTIEEADRLSAPRDPFLLVGHYLINDLVAAGLPADDAVKLASAESPMEERWKLFAPWWERCRFTGYAQAFRIALADLYGVSEVSLRGMESAREQMQQLSAGFYREVLQRRAHIAYSVLDDYWNGEPTRPDPALFVLARKFDWFVAPNSRPDLERMGEVTGVEVNSLAALKRALDIRIDQNLKVGMVTIKSTIAYQRSLEFLPASEADASRDFVRLLALRQRRTARPEDATERPFRALEDHMFHRLLAVAEERGLPIQIHTGMQAGNSNHAPNTRASLLTPCIRRYPRLRFDLFHIGFPWTGDVLALAKMFPNVSVDFCWAWVMSPSLARRALREMLDALPYSKILGFGGDYRYAELSYGHAKMARANITRVLAEMAQDGAFSEEQAVEVAQAILADNAARLFPRVA